MRCNTLFDMHGFQLNRWQLYSLLLISKKTRSNKHKADINYWLEVRLYNGIRVYCEKGVKGRQGTLYCSTAELHRHSAVAGIEPASRRSQTEVTLSYDTLLSSKFLSI